MIDFHSHILPEIDDGASSVEESMQILNTMKTYGVKTVVATPHYYDCYTTVESFLIARDLLYKKLSEAVSIQGLNVPEIILGAEVRLFFDIVNNPLLDNLCIGETKCILIELPDGVWFDWVYDAVKYIKEERGLIPVLAHLERYIASPKDMERFEKFFEQEVYIQINSDSVADRVLWRNIKVLFDKNQVHLIGSDTHNTTSRRFEFGVAQKKITKAYGQQCWQKLHDNATALLRKE